MFGKRKSRDRAGGRGFEQVLLPSLPLSLSLPLSSPPPLSPSPPSLADALPLDHTLTQHTPEPLVHTHTQTLSHAPPPLQVDADRAKRKTLSFSRRRRRTDSSSRSSPSLQSKPPAAAGPRARSAPSRGSAPPLHPSPRRRLPCAAGGRAKRDTELQPKKNTQPPPAALPSVAHHGRVRALAHAEQVPGPAPGLPAARVPAGQGHL